MQTIDASVILDDAYRLMNWDPAQLDSRNKADARAALSQALQEVWEAYWWEDLMQCKSIAPAMKISGLDTADVYSLYQYLLDAEGILEVTDQINAKPAYGALNATAIQWQQTIGSGLHWEITTYDATRTNPLQVCYYSDEDVDTPDLVKTWTAYYADGATDVPEIANVPLPVVSPIITGSANVRSISRLNPQSGSNAGKYATIDDTDGVIIVGLDTGRPWVWARRPTPVLTGDPFADTATYEATDETELVFP